RPRMWLQPQRFFHPGHADEYACADGIDRAQHRIRFEANPPKSIHDAGDHGGAHDADGGSTAEADADQERSSHSGGSRSVDSPTRINFAVFHLTRLEMKF